VHRPCADRAPEVGIGRGGHELPHPRGSGGERLAPALDLVELVGRRLVEHVRVRHGTRPHAAQARGGAGDAACELLQRRIGFVALEHVGRDADGGVAAGRAAVADAEAGERARVGGGRSGSVLGIVGVARPDEEPGVQRPLARERDVCDAQAVGKRLPPDLDRAAIGPRGLSARDVDRDPEHLPRPRLRPCRDGHERIRDLSQQPV
jgi:hypothetical protein